MTPPETARTSSGPMRSEAAHTAILDAAEALLAEGGPSAVTFEAVARRARAGKPTLYRWWPNKAALLLEIYNRNKQRDVQDPDTGSLRGDLTALARALFAHWRNTGAGAAFAALVAEAQFSADIKETLLLYFNNEANSPLSPAMERAIKRGETALPVKPMREAFMAMAWFRLLTGQLQDEAVSGLIDTLLDGFLHRP